MKSETKNLTKSLTIVAVVSIVAITICCLTALGCNPRISIEKEKIEVNTDSNSNLTQ